jgi:hypothetical protein
MVYTYRVEELDGFNEFTLAQVHCGGKSDISRQWGVTIRLKFLPRTATPRWIHTPGSLTAPNQSCQRRLANMRSIFHLEHMSGLCCL